MISLDTLDNIMSISPLKDKMKSFGFEVFETNGHDFKNLSNCFNEIKNSTSNKPKCIIANTIKGNGVKFMENVSKWHFRSPTDEEYINAKKYIDKYYERFI